MAQRIRSFAWLLLKERLLTNKERHRRHLTADQTCSICTQADEDLDHVFKRCLTAAAIWRHLLPPTLYASFVHTLIIPWIISILSGDNWSTSWKIGVLITCWQLWKVRNLSIFSDDTFTVDGILAQIRAIVLHSLNTFSTFLRKCLT